MNVLPVIMAAISAVAPLTSPVDVKPEPYTVDGAVVTEQETSADFAPRNERNEKTERRPGAEDGKIFRRRSRGPYADNAKWHVEFSYKSDSGFVKVSAYADDEDLVAKIGKICELLDD